MALPKGLPRRIYDGDLLVNDFDYEFGDYGRMRFG